METLFATMRLNGMIDHPRLLTGNVHAVNSRRTTTAHSPSHSIGFIPDAAALGKVVQVAEELRTRESDKLKFIYVLDRECFCVFPALSAAPQSEDPTHSVCDVVSMNAF